MLQGIFEHNSLLPAIGWAIANSLWQGAVLWMGFHVILYINKKHTPQFAYHLGLLLSFICFIQFILSIVLFYFSLSNPATGSIWFVQPGNAVFLYVNNWIPYLSLIYLGFILYKIPALLFKIQRISSYTEPPRLKVPAHFRVFVENKAQLIGIKRKVTIWLSSKIEVPSLIGYIKPVILLPLSIINNLSTEQIEALIIHELTHIQRKDYLINQVQTWIETLLFFNPFVRMLNQYVQEEREKCCDDAVLQHQYHQFQYSSALLFFEENRERPIVIEQAATNNKHILLKRIQRMFNRPEKTGNKWFPGIQLAFVGFLALLTTSHIQSLQLSKNELSNNRIVKNTKIVILPEKIAFLPDLSNNSVVFNQKTVKKGKIQNLSNPTVPKRILGLKKQNDEDIALINEDLLPENLKKLAVGMNEKPDKDSAYYFTVEDQQSGSRQANIYYFKLTYDKDSKPVLKPLILMHHVGTLPDSLAKSKLKGVSF